MKLPNADQAIIEREKVADYLLNSGHFDNGGKVPYFVASGFLRDAWKVFAETLRNLTMAADFTKWQNSPHGIKYIFDGEIVTPAGCQAPLWTI
jgi:hypothetical protein